MAVTIHDVAREAKVSPATVSRAFNAHPSVGPEYVKRVRKAAKKLGYRPNVLARNLRRQTSDVIGLLVPDIGNSFHTAMARGIEDVAREAGLSVLLGNSDENSEEENRYVLMVQMQQVAGVLLCPHSPEIDVSPLTEEGIPVVSVDRSIRIPVDTVVSASEEGAYEATKHLAEQGWARIACVTGPKDIETAVKRAQGYQRAIAELGYEPLLAHATYNKEGGVRAVAEFLDAENPPDAVFATNEPMTLGALEEVRRRGLRVGEDVGLVGFDDSAWAPLLDPAITVVAQQPYQVGAQAARMLVERLSGENDIPPRFVVLPTNLVVRDSSLKGQGA